MPRIDREILEWIDGLLQCAGAVCAAGLIAAVFRRRLVDPLFLPFRPTPDGPRAEHLALFLAHFLLPAAVVLMAYRHAISPAPGSHDWHVMHVLTGSSALLVAGCIAVVLRQRPSFAGDPPPSVRRTRLIAIPVGVLIAFFLCFPQLYAAQVIGRTVFEATNQPTHVIIEAIRDSEWGGWGAAALVASAVVIAPMTEELLVRGLLLGVLWYSTGLAWFSILASAAVFGFMHYSQPQDVLPLVTFGIVLGAIRFCTRSLLVCIAVHSLFNLRTMAFVLLNPDMARAAN